MRFFPLSVKPIERDFDSGQDLSPEIYHSALNFARLPLILKCVPESEGPTTKAEADHLDDEIVSMDHHWPPLG
jgi:hypothetical protein